MLYTIIEAFVYQIARFTSRCRIWSRGPQNRFTDQRHVCSCTFSDTFELNQGGHGTGKTGNLVLTFSRQGKHREFCSDTGKNLPTQHRENIWTVIIYTLIFSNFKNFSLASLSIVFDFKVLCTFNPTCYVSKFYLCIYSLCQYIHA